MRTIRRRTARLYADDFPALAGGALKVLLSLSPGQWRSHYSPCGGVITLYRRYTDSACPAFRYVLSDGQDGILHTTATRAGFGGVRWWYVCPHCHTRCGRLYWTRTRAGCRQCLNLHYRCQSESAEHRRYRSIRRGRHAIWGKDTPDIDFLLRSVSSFRKPKGMHWQHYERMIRAQYDRELVFFVPCWWY